MKFLQSFCLVLVVSSSAAAQSDQLQHIPQVSTAQRHAVTVTHRAVAEFETPALHEVVDSYVEVVQDRNLVLTQQVMGTTTYDLQTNASQGQQVAGMGDAVSVAWTQSFQANPFNDRGSGYNHNDGSGWLPQPEARVESAKTGWTTLDRLGSGRDVVMGHSSPSTLGLHFATSEPGSGVWTDGVVPNAHAYDDLSPVGHLWPRLVVGGLQDECLHAICLSLPSYLGGGPYEGQEGAMLYYRSCDEGATWVALALPGLGSEMFYGFEGDQYAIHARGAKVAIAIFNGLQDSVVLISEDNGDTWTTHTIVDFPVDMYFIDSGLPEGGAVDFDGDGLAQEYLSTDGGGDVLIDLDGTVHVAVGAMHYSDLDSTDASYEYYPATNGLLYWREDFGDDSVQVVAYAQDIDGSGVLELTDDIAFYGVNLAGMPCLAVAEDGTLVLSCASVMENLSTSTQNFRHVHVVYSSDGGDSWNSDAPCDVTPDLQEDGYECVFASMPDDLGSTVEMLYQRDYEPGVHIRGDLDPWGPNDLVHLRFDLAELAACADVEVIDVAHVTDVEMPEVTAFPNPATDAVRFSGWASEPVRVVLRNALGQTLADLPSVWPGDAVDLPQAWRGVVLAELTGNGWTARPVLVVN